MSDYLEFRGKCKQMSQALVNKNPSLTLVRGYYICPYWGEQQHWWTKDKNGVIIDPTSKQFPSKGCGEYIEFDGNISCSECGKEISEDKARIEGSYAFCSTKCNARFVGIYL